MFIDWIFKEKTKKELNIEYIYLIVFTSIYVMLMGICIILSFYIAYYASFNFLIAYVFSQVCIFMLSIFNLKLFDDRLNEIKEEYKKLR